MGLLLLLVWKADLDLIRCLEQLVFAIALGLYDLLSMFGSFLGAFALLSLNVGVAAVG